MRQRYTPVIAPKERQKVLRQIILVDGRQRAHDAEIERDVLTRGRNENVAGMHVGVEKAVAEYLGKKYFHAGAREPGDINALRTQRVDVRHWRAAHALHYHHFG